uniref:HTH domain-containing protein n=1 Tax=uncultured Brevibacillus sp. TaxID=169970 RepID=UPI00338F4745
MSKKVFTEKEIKLLKQNPYVKSVSSKAITYTDEFKRIFIVEHENGKIRSHIFEEYGFDVDVIGLQRVKSSADRWLKAYRENGVDGLSDSRAEHAGRPREKELTLEEKYARLEAQNN